MTSSAYRLKLTKIDIKISMKNKKKYLFGPVPSRRLGLSLGVDVVPYKVCSFDCLYCQVGKTTESTIERKEYIPVNEVLEQLKERIKSGLHADYITLSGSGEPTLNSKIEKLIDGIKKLTNIPVAVLTNGTLLFDADVRRAVCKADLVLPSLDAGSEEVFRKINRPCKEITLARLIDGLCALRSDFEGQIWLEVFIINRINTDKAELEKIKQLISKIKPDRVQLNTAVRPTVEKGITGSGKRQMEEIAEFLGGKCEIIADFTKKIENEDIKATEQQVLEMLQRRPCSLDDICSGLGIHRNEATKYTSHFQNAGIIETEKRGEKLFFKAKP
jgi:wyosine [tRNA(Phe)-imidazoG37] synthetase (radical SAM superfamily)